MADTAPLWRSRPTGFDIRSADGTRQRAVTPTIHVSEGNSNAYLLVTPAGRVVINTGLGFEAPIHKAYFDGVDSGPIRYVVFTQGHVDHVGGAEVFRGLGTELVAHENNPEHQAYDARLQPFRTRRAYFAWAAAIEGKARAQGGSVPVQSKPVPTILVGDRRAFSLGGVAFECIGCPGAETEDSLVVWLPAERICFTGNVFGALFGHFPNLVTLRGDRYRDPLRYVATLDRLRALDAEMLLTGHHEPVVGRQTIRDELARMRDAVLYVHDAVVTAMNAGQDVWTAMREIKLPPALGVGEGYGRVSWSVRAIWEMYGGWFHARATSELYPAPPDHGAAALVALAGGAVAVAAEATKRLANDPLTALHLVEAAEQAEPESRDALAASLAVHRALLARSERNFWEVRWLESEIRRLERALGASR